MNHSVGSKFVREVITTNPNKPPSIILYTDEQLKLLINAIENGNIIGMDRTFNLSSCYLTTICFKNANVLSKISSENPIILGPMFLSWDGHEHTYQRFLSHLQIKLKVTDRSKIVFGSDQEQAMVNAIEDCFPDATHILCTRHLKDNARENLRKTQPQPIVAQILTKLFDAGGLLDCDGLVAYNEVESEIKENYNIPYLNNKLLPLLRGKVFQPRQNNPNIPLKWTNNNNESYNRVIKQNNQWTVWPLPTLIDKLQELDQDQTTDLRACIHGRGRFTLSSQAQQLYVSHETWIQLPMERKERRFLRFLNNRVRASSTVTSTDGCLTVPSVGHVAKKPGERKRTVNVKTTTVTTKKPKLS